MQITIFPYSNISSTHNKFENVCELVKSLRMDVSSWKGGILVYIKSSLPSKMLTKFKLPNKFQTISFELNLRQEK